MRRPGPALLLAALTALGACARLGSATPGRSTPSAAAPRGASDVPFGELPPQRLERGQCALFLWSRTTPPRRVLMALNDPAIARVRLGGRTVDLARTRVEGPAAFGHARTQSYAGAGASLVITVDMESRGGVVGGAVVPTAAIEYRTVAGWTIIVPAAGLLACQS